MIRHLDGNCHVYIDRAADLEMAHAIAFQAKTYRYGVCGSMETLLVHQDIAEQVLPRLAAAYVEKGVALRGCPRTLKLVPQALPPPMKTGQQSTWRPFWPFVLSTPSMTP